MTYHMSAPMASGRGQWVVFVWRGTLKKRHIDNRMMAYGGSRIEAISRALKLRRCLR